MKSSVEATVEAPAAAVFDLISDIDRLPEWNANVTEVVERPSGELAAGAEWVVEFRAMGQSWRSRSRLEEIDRERRVFTYRSGTDDGNPSYALWRWQVEGNGTGSDVTVQWDLHPATFWRKVLLGPVRHRQLRRSEVPASIAALEAALARAG
jgi:uncharacterized protein YndB with AHSA1/START domain